MIYQKYKLIDAYLDAKFTQHRDDELKKYSADYSNALSSAFNVDMGSVKSGKTAILMLFNSTCRTYLGIHGIRENYADDSLINIQLERAGEAGDRLQQQEADVHDKISSTKSALYDLMCNQFDFLWPIGDTECTSEDLMKVGFDDSLRPREKDDVEDW